MTSRFAGVLATLLLVAALAGCLEVPQFVSPLPSPSPVPAGPPMPPAVSGAFNGSYALTLTLGSDCAAVPEAERIRRYEATIAPGPPGLYAVTLAGGEFLSGDACTSPVGLGCNQFTATEYGDTVTFLLNGAGGHGGQIVERTADGAWIQISGDADGVRRRPSGVIEASGTVSVVSCPTPSANPFDCPDARSCGYLTSLRMTLTPR